MRNEMTPSESEQQHMQASACHAARAVIAFLPIADLSPQDREDIRQSAVLGFWLGWRRSGGNFSYAWKSAYNEALKFAERNLFGRNPFTNDASEFNYDIFPLSESPSSGQRSSLPPDVKNFLFDIFFTSRIKRGQRGKRAAAREVKIIDLVWQGYSNVGIANELNISTSAAKRYRLNARQRLAAFIHDSTFLIQDSIQKEASNEEEQL